MIDGRPPKACDAPSPYRVASDPTVLRCLLLRDHADVHQTEWAGRIYHWTATRNEEAHG